MDINDDIKYSGETDQQGVMDDLISKRYPDDDSSAEIGPLPSGGWETFFSCRSSVGDFANQT